MYSIAEGRGILGAQNHNNCARSAVDLCLEQTVNKSAASPSKGLVHFHNSTDTIRQWCISSNQRNMGVTEMQKLAGLEKIDKPSRQTTKPRIARDIADRKSLETTLKETCNPFDGPVVTSGHLINIASGKSVGKNVETYLKFM